ncbi:MAG: hypothetical protein LBN41_04865 [Enterobacteriaceae bacterium]|jgi:hypothetical protein|nr:hypothetical protein [Enterobacteriaceae bacterium]
MKYVVSGGATLSFADGTKFELLQGIYDGSHFPGNVKDHWAFKAYAKPLDESELADEQNAEDLAASLVLLAEENNTLKAQLDAALAAAGGKPADTTDKTENTGGDAKNAKKQQASN